MSYRQYLARDYPVFLRVLGGVHLAAGLVLLVVALAGVFEDGLDGDPGVMFWIALLGFVALFGVLKCIVGIGLLRRCSWAPEAVGLSALLIGGMAVFAFPPLTVFEVFTLVMVFVHKRSFPQFKVTGRVTDPESW